MSLIEEALRRQAGAQPPPPPIPAPPPVLDAPAPSAPEPSAPTPAREAAGENVVNRPRRTSTTEIVIAASLVSLMVLFSLALAFRWFKFSPGSGAEPEPAAAEANRPEPISAPLAPGTPVSDPAPPARLEIAAAALPPPTPDAPPREPVAPPAAAPPAVTASNPPSLSSAAATTNLDAAAALRPFQSPRTAVMPEPPPPPPWPRFVLKAIAVGPNSLVILDSGEMLGPGESSRNGVRVAQITADGVGFVWQGQTNVLRKGECSDKPLP